MLDAEAIGATARFSTALPAINLRGGRVSGRWKEDGRGSQPRRETHARVLPGYPEVDPAIGVTILGHVQRNGTPTAFDRSWAPSWSSRY